MNLVRSLMLLSLSVAACGDTSARSGSHDPLTVGGQGSGAAPVAYAGPLVGEGSNLGLDCPRGGDTAPVGVEFYCGEIIVVTCKDLSNVVLELTDGTRTRFEGLHGHQNRFVVGDGNTLSGVWVKAGNNESGDGPGYGERVDAPAGACLPPPGSAPPDDECMIVDNPCTPYPPPPSTPITPPGIGI